MRAKCYCNVRVTSIRDASWVEEFNGVTRPFCTTACHDRYLQKEADRLEGEHRRAEMRSIESRTVITGSFEDGFSVEDRIGNEVYAAYEHANEMEA